MPLTEQQFGRLRGNYPGSTLERQPDGSALITIPDFPLPPGWNKERTSIVFLVPVGYPMAQPDTFWADADLRLRHGGFPANTDLNTRYGRAEPRLWFSYHPTTWDPSRDTLLTFAKLIRRRLDAP